MTKKPIAVADEFAKQIGIEKPMVEKRLESVNAELIDIGEGVDPFTFIEKLKEATSTEGIAFVQPNYVYELQSTHSNTNPTDPQKNSSWHLKAIQIRNAWEVVDENTDDETPTVTVGIIDSGIDFSNEDLDDVMWSVTTCKDETGGDVSDCVNGGYDVTGDSDDGVDGHDNDPAPGDSGPHGTTVASVVAGEYENGYGVIGVAKDGVEIVGIRVFEPIEFEIPGIFEKKFQPPPTEITLSSPSQHGSSSPSICRVVE